MFSNFSRVGFGTAALHHVLTHSKRLDLLDIAYDADIRYFDTAPLYGHESSERLLGRFIRKHQSIAKTVVATKVGLRPNSLVCAVPPLLIPYIAFRVASTRTRIVPESRFQPARDYSAKYLVQRVERSLRNMGLDSLDVVYLHEPCIEDLRELDSLADAAASLKTRGLVRAFGVSASQEAASYLRHHSPFLSEVLQVEVPSQGSPSLSAWFAENAAVTFGHFRKLKTQGPSSSKEERLRFVARSAVALNPAGTILFSSTNTSHVTDFVSAIKAADKEKNEGVSC